MTGHISEQSINNHLSFAIDTSDKLTAERLTLFAKQVGISTVKYGLELSSATSWRYCADLAEDYDIHWIADAKLHDIGTTTVRAATNIATMPHAPRAIPMHTASKLETLRCVQQEVADVAIFGVTLLSDMPAQEAVHRFADDKLSYAGLVMRAAKVAVSAGLKGIVCAPTSVALIKSNPLTRDLVTLVPGARSHGVMVHEQVNTLTPTATLAAGADLLVVGREISEAQNPHDAYAHFIRHVRTAQ